MVKVATVNILSNSLENNYSYIIINFNNYWLYSQ